MRRLAALSVVFAAFSALASQPGQPLDCSDWVSLEAGISCSVYSPFGVDPNSAFLRRGANKANDILGRLLVVVPRNNFPSVGESSLVLAATDGVIETVLGYFPACRGDFFAHMDCISCIAGRGGEAFAGDTWLASTVSFDPANGRLLISLESYGSDHNSNPRSCYAGLGTCFWIAAIDGFTTLYELSQTYAPTQGTFSYRTPYMPEGMRAADRFDTYWGAVTQPLELANAHPLQCSYPPTPPSVGDYLQITAPIPTPAPGSANYVLTSVTHEGQTRAGRKASGGKLTGRDASRLPACLED